MGKKISDMTGSPDLTGSEEFEIEVDGETFKTHLDAMRGFISPFVVNENWEDFPSAATVKAGALGFCRSHPAHVGSYWKAIPWGPLWAPLSGEVLLGITGVATTEDDTAEQIVWQYSIGASMAFPAAALLLFHALEKSSGAIAATMRVRIGPNGDLTDPVVQTVSLQAASRSPEVRTDIKFTATDACSVSPSLDNGAIDPTVVSSDVTFGGDITAENQYVSVTIEHASAGVTVTIKNGFMKLIVV